METTKPTKSVNVTITVDPGLLEEFDTSINEAHYTSRSAAIAAAMRDLMDKIESRSKR